MSNKLYYLVPIALLLLCFLFYQRQDADQDKDSSSESNVVNVYSSRKEQMVRDVFAAFTEETGIKVNYITDDAIKLISRMKSEGKNTSADVFIAADVVNLAFAERENLLQCISSAVLESAIPSNLRNCYWFGLTRRTRLIVYSKDRVNPSEIKDYEDLSNPKWKDRLLLRSSNSPYNQSLIASMIFANGLEKTESWIKGVVRNMARPPYGGDIDQIKGVASGEGDLAVVNSYYVARILASDKNVYKKVAEKIGVIFPNQDNRGAMVNISGAGVTRYAKNKENAIKFLQFMVSRKAQEMYATENHEYPILASVENSEILKSWGAYKLDSTDLSKIAPYMSVAILIADENGWK
ncbi:iron uptake protein A1 [Neorickettsia helminthoeca str. Oregon]|uniref:Iron uptake protein A1 n=1 Tax=Neorickettsia helminthoeca str. Oregon TaxID=1286528 RepID=X5GVC4_9RICK|nr:Fe(3+) ABC transporter substrate-binding protein [Neorickettsia helminthoeca]AHX10987.1 iron uptake protein A1 [Neorickettsia helminthoeca str. Oregon]